jgi:uncharacterized Fe-S radical SAM superfamily protein PflX
LSFAAKGRDPKLPQINGPVEVDRRVSYFRSANYRLNQFPLSGVKRTCRFALHMSRSQRTRAIKGEDFLTRHLVMPNHVEYCTYPVLEWIAEHATEVPSTETNTPRSRAARHLPI